MTIQFSRDHCHLLSFPTRRSSDLDAAREVGQVPRARGDVDDAAAVLSRRSDPEIAGLRRRVLPLDRPDRKSTRLNSSHLVISYAVFCLKKTIMITAAASVSSSNNF